MGDREQNEKKKPAFQRLKLLSKIENALKKESLHDEFLTKDGCQILSDWMKQMPDGTLPNPKIISTIMGIIESLPITTDVVMESDLQKVLNMYKNGEFDQPGYNQCMA